MRPSAAGGPLEHFGSRPTAVEKIRSAGDPFFALVRTCARRHRADTRASNHVHSDPSRESATRWRDRAVRWNRSVVIAGATNEMRAMQEETGALGSVEGDGRAPAPVDGKKSITKHAITCLECGRTLRQLSNRHLEAHGLDRRSYRAKYGIPRTQPLSAKETTARRKRILKAARP